jgi:uncharacterized phiE125 gp8 family phage protein
VEVKIVTDLVVEPVSLDLAKVYCKVDDTSTVEADLLTLLLTAARQLCEQYTQKSFGPKTLSADLTQEDFYKLGHLPFGPNITVTAVTDSEGTVMPTEIFESPGYYGAYQRGFTVQNTSVDEGCTSNGTVYTVEYSAGYNTDELPGPCKLAILQTVHEFYENRGNTVVGTIIADLPQNAKNNLKPYRAKTLF